MKKSLLNEVLNMRRLMESTTTSVDYVGILRGYIACAVWTEEEQIGADGQGLGYDDLAEDSLIKAYTDIKQFMAQAGQAASIAIEENGVDQLGHDIWLTRNRHGAGFMDRSYDPEIEAALTRAAQALGEIHLDFNDGGKLSFSNEHI